MDNYKKQISDKVKDSITDWIARQKIEQPDQLLRSNWKILFPKGFSAGQNTVPVLTPAKGGKRLVGEIGFYLQDDLILNIDEVELTLKNELYKEPKKKKVKQELKSVDSSLDVINNIIIGASELMASLSGINAPKNNLIVPGLASHVKTTQLNPAVESPPKDDLTKTVRLMLLHPDLPEYVRTIQDKNVRDKLLEKMAEAYLHYSNRVGSSVD